MADPTRYPDVAEDTRAGAYGEPASRAPLWVWVLGIVVLGTSLAMLFTMFLAPLLMGAMSGGHS